MTYSEHFKQFRGAKIGQIAESFLFGMLVNSLQMRRSVVRIQDYELAGDIASITKEFVQFAKWLVFFENVYADGSPVLSMRD